MIRRKLMEGADSQIAGPFGKLGRYALKTHWGIRVPARGESDRQDPAGPGETREAREPEAQPEREKQGESLFRRFWKFIRR